MTLASFVTWPDDPRGPQPRKSSSGCPSPNGGISGATARLVVHVYYAPSYFMDAFLLLGGCASSSVFTFGADRPADELRCEQRSDRVFAISGKIDDAMAACVRAKFQPTTRELILNSEGGNVSAALDIAEILEGKRLHMVVEGQCNSSCANYVLPLAGRITIRPGAVALLHGSIDPWTVEKFKRGRNEFLKLQAKAGRSEDRAVEAFDELIANTEALKARQAEFAHRNAIPPGWLLYREAGSDRVRGLADLPRLGRAFLVEEQMLRSCLSATITPCQEDLRRSVLNLPRRFLLSWAGVTPSGKARCTPDPSEGPAGVP